MKDQKNTLIETVPAARELRKVPGFDPLKFLRKTVTKTGETALKLDLPYKRLWFRLACPDGRMLLNHLRITDQMAIFEARVYAGRDDASLIASFTSTQTVQDAPGGQYIRAAQDEALNEALDNAGFGIQLCDVAQVSDGSGFGSEVPLEQPKAQSTEQPPAEEPVSVSPEMLKEAPPTEVPEQAPVAAPPLVKEPAPQATSNVISMPAHEPPPAPAIEAVTAPAAAVETAPAPQTVSEAPAAGEAPQTAPRYTADMTVEEIQTLMTLEEAKQIIAPLGSCKGMTLGKVAAERKASLKWYLYAKTDNIVKAGATLLLEDLGLNKAG